jgi:quinol-cytochrome oxidoreductase complex cytochrome b subunit
MDLIISNLIGVPVIGPALITVILGGSELDVVPLQRGYALHVWFLPLVLFFLLAGHILVAWRQGLTARPDYWHRIREKLPIKRSWDFLPGLALLILIVSLSAITPHNINAGATDRSALPHPDWLLMFYFLPFWFFEGSGRIIGTLVIPTAILIFLSTAPRFSKPSASRFLRLSLILIGLAGVLWLFGQMSFMGYQIPIQGCNACHRESILGEAPQDLSEFKIRNPDWLIHHLKDPLQSIFEPADEPLELP